MKTYYQGNLDLDRAFGRTDNTVPTSYYIGLSITPISRDGSGATEPLSSTGYARVQVQNTKTNFSTSSNGEITNTLDISFPESTATWGTVTHVFISDAVTGGNIRYYEALGAPRLLNATSTLMFKQQTLKSY